MLSCKKWHLRKGWTEMSLIISDAEQSLERLATRYFCTESLHSPLVALWWVSQQTAPVNYTACKNGFMGGNADIPGSLSYISPFFTWQFAYSLGTLSRATPNACL